MLGYTLSGIAIASWIALAFKLVEGYRIMRDDYNNHKSFD